MCHEDAGRPDHTQQQHGHTERASRDMRGELYFLTEQPTNPPFEKSVVEKPDRAVRQRGDWSSPLGEHENSGRKRQWLDLLNGCIVSQNLRIVTKVLDKSCKRGDPEEGAGERTQEREPQRIKTLHMCRFVTQNGTKLAIAEPTGQFCRDVDNRNERADGERRIGQARHDPDASRMHTSIHSCGPECVAFPGLLGLKRCKRFRQPPPYPHAIPGRIGDATGQQQVKPAVYRRQQHMKSGEAERSEVIHATQRAFQPTGRMIHENRQNAQYDQDHDTRQHDTAMRSLPGVDSRGGVGRAHAQFAV